MRRFTNNIKEFSAWLWWGWEIPAKNVHSMWEREQDAFELFFTASVFLLLSLLFKFSCSNIKSFFCSVPTFKISHLTEQINSRRGENEDEDDINNVAFIPCGFMKFYNLLEGLTCTITLKSTVLVWKPLSFVLCFVCSLVNNYVNWTGIRDEKWK